MREALQGASATLPPSSARTACWQSQVRVGAGAGGGRFAVRKR